MSSSKTIKEEPESIDLTHDDDDVDDKKRLVSKKRVPLQASLEERVFSKGPLTMVTQPKMGNFFSAPASQPQRSHLSTSLDPPLPPGVVLVRGFMSIDEQNRVVETVDDLHSSTPLYVQNYGKGTLKFFISSFGLHWSNKGYSLRRDDFDQADVLRIPSLFADIASRAFGEVAPHSVRAAVNDGVLPFCPVFSSGLCNFYPPLEDMPVKYKPVNGGQVKLGKHQDNQESLESLAAGLPVLSLSIGNSADFKLFPTEVEWGDNLQAHLKFKSEGRGGSAKGKGVLGKRGRDEAAGGGSALTESDLQCEVTLNSGDLLIFGGSSRLVSHEISTFHKDSRPEGLKMRSGRLNVTMRCDPWTLETLRGKEEAKQLRASLAKTPSWHVSHEKKKKMMMKCTVKEEKEEREEGDLEGEEVLQANEDLEALQANEDLDVVASRSKRSKGGAGDDVATKR